MSHSISRNLRRGSTTVLFALMLPTVIIPMTGLGIDATMLYIVQAKLSAAVDGAALGSGRLLGTTANASEIAGEFLRANFRDNSSEGFWGAKNLVPNVSVTLGTTKTITVNASVEVPLVFAKIFGKPTATVTARAVSTRRDARVMLVIDRSGSMTESDHAGSTVITDVISYAQSFVGKFTPGVDQLGLIVYDGSAVVGYPSVRPWDPTVSATATGGPNSAFADGSSTDMLHQIRAIRADSGTGIADALSIAYVELQKAHLKEIQAKGLDDRLSSIVLFTDGVPSGVSLFLNNPSDNMIKTTSTCTNKDKGSTPVNRMWGWYAIPGPPFSTSSSNGVGSYLLASLDTNAAHTAAWWMSNGNSSSAKDVGAPAPSAAFGNCPYVDGNSSLGRTVPDTDFSTIPQYDMYGNSLTGTGYTNSRVVNQSGSVSSIYNGTGLDRAKKDRDYHWGLAIWNAADDAANRIRADINKPNRAGDTQSMQIAIYTIGYMGSKGIDEGLLKRISNDKASSSYNASQSTGLYVSGSNPNALAAAFDTIASVILRLSQ